MTNLIAAVSLIYFENNVPKKVGSIVNNTKLAKSLNIISNNGYSINNGKIANLIQRNLFPNISKFTNPQNGLISNTSEFPGPLSGPFSMFPQTSIFQPSSTRNEKNQQIFSDSSEMM